MLPIELKKEHPGYVLNSLLDAAVGLLADGVAAPETVDRTWRIATGAPMGPLQILDMVGLNTAYNIDAPGNEEQRRFARFLKDNYIDKGNSASAPAKDSTAISQPATQITLSLACPPNEY